MGVVQDPRHGLGIDARLEDSCGTSLGSGGGSKKAREAAERQILPDHPRLRWRSGGGTEQTGSFSWQEGLWNSVLPGGRGVDELPEAKIRWLSYRSAGLARNAVDL